MNERIDHLADAMACLVAADSVVSTEMALNTGDYKSDVLAYAQVHATLALVEQQRIANILTYLSLPDKIHATPSDLWPEVSEALGL